MDGMSDCQCSKTPLSILGCSSVTQTVRKETYWEDGEIHRWEGAAIIAYDKNGKIVQESHLIHNKLDVDEGPTTVIYDRISGNVKRARYHSDGKLLLDIKVVGYNHS